MSPGAVGQVVIAAGAILGLLAPLGTFPIVAGPFLVTGGAILAAPEASLPGVWLGSWWRLTAISAFVCLIGLGIWFVSGQVGTAMVMIGSLGAAFSVAFGPGPRD